jgi:poly-gamma-glutamate synthesis protein (capsule biosynthesis protein)
MPRIAFTGDLSFSARFSDACSEDFVDQEVVGWLGGTDHVVANVECPVTSKPIQSDQPLTHASTPEILPQLRKLRVDVLNLANNHMLDCGEDGLLDTLAFAAGNRLSAIGAGKTLAEASRPLVLGGGDGVKVGLLSAAKPWEHIRAGDSSPGCFTWDRAELLRRRIGELRESADWVVLAVHGGEEFCDIPMPYIRRQYLGFLDAGADVVVGHHPHVVQPYELIGKKAIFYSLGNFIFDTDNQRDFPHTENSVLLAFDFGKTAFRFDFLATRHNRATHRIEPRPAPPVFRDLGAAPYRKWWAAASKPYYFRNLKRRRKFDPNFKTRPKWWLFLRELHDLKRRDRFTLLLGAILSPFLRASPADRELLRYLSEE